MSDENDPAAPPPEKRKRGRPKGTGKNQRAAAALAQGMLPPQPVPTAHKPTKKSRQLVRIMASERIAIEQIAAVLKIEPEVLQRWYLNELQATDQLLAAEVSAHVFEIATQGDSNVTLRAAELWLRCKGGWHEFTPKPFSPTVPVKPPTEQKPQKLGKKEQAAKDAQENPTDGGWAGLVN